MERELILNELAEVGDGLKTALAHRCPEDTVLRCRGLVLRLLLRKHFTHAGERAEVLRRSWWRWARNVTAAAAECFRAQASFCITVIRNQAVEFISCLHLAGERGARRAKRRACALVDADSLILGALATV